MYPKSLEQFTFTHLHKLCLSLDFLLSRALMRSLDGHLCSLLARCKMVSGIMKPGPWRWSRLNYTLIYTWSSGKWLKSSVSIQSATEE